MLGFLGSIGSALAPILKNVGRGLASSLISQHAGKINQGLSKAGIPISMNTLKMLKNTVDNNNENYIK